MTLLTVDTPAGVLHNVTNGVCGKHVFTDLQAVRRPSTTTDPSRPVWPTKLGA